jgi:hypothetical protein
MTQATLVGPIVDLVKVGHDDDFYLKESFSY